jgi:hypothetical protein
MNTLFNTIGGVLVAVGLMAMAGSANDCDGACVETANTLSEMLTVMIMGMAAMGVGGYILFITNNK